MGPFFALSHGHRLAICHVVVGLQSSPSPLPLVVDSKSFVAKHFGVRKPGVEKREKRTESEGTIFPNSSPRRIRLTESRIEGLGRQITLSCICEFAEAFYRLDT
ncbi:Hypothetical protein NTJ_05493 [Nesidiocoris tenuis]|uniref:PID domain-containing protein n=1 Tax=Nesidiocoris tenuis TaxID=355587 RepID=A0ABN7AN66_9HEMI|nr:Hypothetical protein NTJ_05493 [Nesidiocoris tenuis]